MRRKEKGGQGREPWIEAAGNGHDVRIRVAGCGKSSVELGPHLLHLNGVVRHNGSLRPEKLLAKRRESRAFALFTNDELLSESLLPDLDLPPEIAVGDAKAAGGLLKSLAAFDRGKLTDEKVGESLPGLVGRHDVISEFN